MILTDVIAPCYNIDMNCLICSKTHNNQKYCSRVCSEKSKFGRKRPDLVLRNKTNNPIHNPEARAKMIKGLTGRVQTKTEIDRRVAAIKKRHESDPTLRFRQTEKVREFAQKKEKGWNRIRKIALERDNYTCQNCNKDNKRLIVHHKDHRGMNLPYSQMNNDLDNLVSLCYGCHLSIHTWAVRRALGK